VVAAPSGAGKTSLVRALLGRMPELRLSVSHTTRPRRPTEQHGREYWFVPTVDAFRGLIAGDEFLEHAQVFDHFYGTARGPVETELARGRDVLLEIDWQGARQVRHTLPECRSIFVLPPSLAELEARLRRRGTDSAEVIARRLRDAVSDMSHYQEFDYVVVNDRFEDALDALAEIVRGRGEPWRTQRVGLAPLLKELLGGAPAPTVFSNSGMSPRDVDR